MLDSGFTYPRLFDLDDSTFDHNLPKDVKLEAIEDIDDTTCNLTDDIIGQKVFDNDSITDHNSISASNTYMSLLQSDVSNNDTEHSFDDIPTEQQNNPAENCLDLLDYDYMEQSSEVDDQEQPYNLDCEPYHFDSIFTPENQLCDDNMPINLAPSGIHPLDCITPETHLTGFTPFESGMPRRYVSLSDVNSFVAKADCAKIQLYNLHAYSQDFFSSSDNDDDSDDDDQWQPQKREHHKQKCIIKLKKSASVSDALPHPYIDRWNFKSVRGPTKRKSMSIGATTKKKGLNKGRRGSAPLRLANTTHSPSMSSLNSASSLSSLANSFQEALYVSDMSLFGEHYYPMEGGEEYHQHHLPFDGEIDQAPVKKGRNVDKACNHCKRSHLRCDDMRPCRRCVATGKTGCKDVQHKPRGRPKLQKNL